MKHELIKTENYLLVVDSPVIENESQECVANNSGLYLTAFNYIHRFEKGDIIDQDDMFIIAHLPLNGSLVLEGVDLLPEIPSEGEELANELTSHLSFPEERKHGFIQGYNRAKEKYEFTGEDMISFALSYHNEQGLSVDNWGKDLFLEWRKKLAQYKLPVAFECEFEEFGTNFNQEDKTVESLGIRRKTNNPIVTGTKGAFTWVGKYVFKQD